MTINSNNLWKNTEGKRKLSNAENTLFVYIVKWEKQFKHAQTAHANYLVLLLFVPNKPLVPLPETLAHQNFPFKNVSNFE